MANLQVKNVPESLHRRLQALADRLGRTMSDVVLEAVRRDVEQAEFVERLRKRASVHLGIPAADLVAEERAGREPRPRGRTRR